MAKSTKKVGRKPHKRSKYETWLSDMKPFLKQGNSLNYAIQKAGLSKHKDSIYRKYRENNEFCEKIDTFRQYPGELINSLFARIVLKIEKRVDQDKDLTSEEYKTLRWYAEKHRTAQQFFTNRQEVIETTPDEISTLLDSLETDYGQVAIQAKTSLQTT